ncbi:cation:proton antiporter [Streptomyces sp. NPDC058374]|uniref:cation:proton antiporter domain-containing protein n=1 Tax=unclassified Streptomyces TaxID=2593676 RepID=UPI003650449B
MTSSSLPLTQILLAVPAVVLTCQLGGAVFRRLGQPPVIGEIAMGIALGPSLFGALWPEGQHWLLSSSTTPFLDGLGQLGLLSFMFLIGTELDLATLRGHSRTALAVSQVSIALPAVCGALLALAMYGPLAPKGVGRTPFVLFIAVSMSITAFPVLARILADRGLTGTPLAALAIACAAVDDVAAWCLLAVVVAIAGSGSALDALTTAALAASFLLAMLYVVRPLLALWVRRATQPRDGLVLALLFSGACLASLATDEIGVHSLFGAFVFGTIVPRDSPTVARSTTRLGAFVVPVLLPLFFVQTGLRTNFGLLGDNASAWLWAGAILIVAAFGKWGGSALTARLTGRSWRDSLTIGALMNCRGLTELVVLNIGLDLGVISSEVFTMLVLMALITTVATSPALALLHHGAPTSTDLPLRDRSTKQGTAKTPV